MLDTYGANAAASVPTSAMSDPAAISAAISTAYGLRLDDVALADPTQLQAAGAAPSGQLMTAVSARPGRVLGDDRFVSLPIDPDVMAYVVSDQRFQLGHGVADGQAFWFFVNEQGQISAPHAAWANQQTANSWIVPEIGGAVAIAPLNQDFVRQALDETIFTIGFGGINGARAVANAATFAWNHPGEAAQVAWNGLQSASNYVARNGGVYGAIANLGFQAGQHEAARVANAWQTGTMGRYTGSLIGGAVLAEAVPIPGLPRAGPVRPAAAIGDVGTFSQIVSGRIRSGEMSSIAAALKRDHGTEIIFNSPQARRGSFFDTATNEIHFQGGPTKQRRGLFYEEVQHAYDFHGGAYPPGLTNQGLHAITARNLVANPLLPTTPSQDAALLALAERWSR